MSVYVCICDDKDYENEILSLDIDKEIHLINKAHLEKYGKIKTLELKTAKDSTEFFTNHFNNNEEKEEKNKKVLIDTKKLDQLEVHEVWRLLEEIEEYDESDIYSEFYEQLDEYFRDRRSKRFSQRTDESYDPYYYCIEYDKNKVTGTTN